MYFTVCDGVNVQYPSKAHVLKALTSNSSPTTKKRREHDNSDLSSELIQLKILNLMALLEGTDRRSQLEGRACEGS